MAARKPKPKLTDAVVFHVPAATTPNAPLVAHAAMVTRVYEDGTVDVYVATGGGNWRAFERVSYSAKAAANHWSKA